MNSLEYNTDPNIIDNVSEASFNILQTSREYTHRICQKVWSSPDTHLETSMDHLETYKISLFPKILIGCWFDQIVKLIA